MARVAATITALAPWSSPSSRTPGEQATRVEVACLYAHGEWLASFACPGCRSSL